MTIIISKIPTATKAITVNPVESVTFNPTDLKNCVTGVSVALLLVLATVGRGKDVVVIFSSLILLVLLADGDIDAVVVGEEVIVGEEVVVGEVVVLGEAVGVEAIVEVGLLASGGISLFWPRKLFKVLQSMSNNVQSLST